MNIIDKRGDNKVDHSERCRVCGSPEVHTQEYNKPTMLCIGYLREEIAKLKQANLILKQELSM